MQDKKYIQKDVVREVIGRKCKNAPVPTMLSHYWGIGLPEKYGAELMRLDEEFPDDVYMGYYLEPGTDISTLPNNPEYRWGFRDYTGVERHGIGQNAVLLSDWSELDEFLEKMPRADEPYIFDHLRGPIAAAKEQGRYCSGFWWRLFHERLWQIRGMENLMYDYYDHSDLLKKLCAALLKYYKGLIDRYAEMGCDGIFTSDDLGHQRGPMMSPEIFEEIYYPFYKQFADYVHAKGMQFILHSCGNNTDLLPYLIRAGVDVFHPVQKGCMDYRETAERFGKEITFLVGIDVQHLLPEAAPGKIRKEVERLYKIFYKNEGGLMFAVGNGVMPDTPLENIHTMLEVIRSYR